MKPPGYHTREEIFSQPLAWKQTLEEMNSKENEVRKLIHTNSYRNVVFTGCGSSYYLSLAAARVLQEQSGLPARGLPASEIWLDPALYIEDQSNLLIAVSRSGQTTETVQACKTFLANGYGDVLTISCYPGRSLAKIGSYHLVFPFGQEKSVAQTRSFTSQFLATVALSSIWGNKKESLHKLSSLPEACHLLLSEYDDLIQELADNDKLDRFYFLGSGLRFGLACEVMLKMKEMSLSYSEAFPFLEFRHGPMSMVSPGTLVVGLLSEKNMAREFEVLKEMHDLGAKIMAITPTKMANDDIEYALTLPGNFSDVERGALYLPLLQLLAFYRALHHGLNPDCPRHLSSVVTLKDLAS